MNDCVPEDVLFDFCQGVLPGAEGSAVRVHLDRCGRCRSSAEHLLALTRLRSGPLGEPSPEADSRVRAVIAKIARRQRRRRVPVLGFTPRRLVAAAVVLAGSWILLQVIRPGRPVEPDRTVAFVSASRPGVTVRRGGADRLAEPGLALHGDETVSVPADATAVVTLADESRVELGPQTVLDLEAPEADRGSVGLALREGFLAVDAAPQRPGSPMRVRTPDADAVVRGTRFTLAAHERRTNLRVAEGLVHLTRLSDGASVDVPAGHRSTVADNAPLEPGPSLTGTALLVVSRTNAPPEWDRFNRLLVHRLVGDRLRQLGFRVETRNHQDLLPGDLAGRPLVIVSVSEENVGFEDSLRRIGLAAAPVPVLCLEPVAFPALGMTGPVRGRDFDWGDGGPSAFAFPNARHPLSGGLGGDRVDLGGQVGVVGWARPGPDAVRVAVWPDDQRRAVEFGYDAGARMADGVAPRRRVGLFLDPARVDERSAGAWALFEAAVNWCVEPAGRP